MNVGWLVRMWRGCFFTHKMSDEAKEFPHWTVTRVQDGWKVTGWSNQGPIDLLHLSLDANKCGFCSELSLACSVIALEVKRKTASSVHERLATPYVWCTKCDYKRAIDEKPRLFWLCMGNKRRFELQGIHHIKIPSVHVQPGACN